MMKNNMEQHINNLHHTDIILRLKEQRNGNIFDPNTKYRQSCALTSHGFSQLHQVTYYT